MKDAEKKYVCQHWHEFSSGDGGWAFSKTVYTEQEALDWVKSDPDGDSRFYELRKTKHSPVYDSIKSLEKDIDADKIMLNLFKGFINELENDWNMSFCDLDGTVINPPECNRPLLLIIRKDSGRFVYRTQIFNEWTKELFYNNDVVAWKYIVGPSWVSDGEYSHPAHILLDDREPTCELW